MNERFVEPIVEVRHFSNEEEVAAAQLKLAKKAIPQKADWYMKALCGFAENTDIFIETQSKKSVDRAKAFCHACPVSEDCLAEALDEDIHSGVLGGLTPKERERLSSRTRRATR